MIPTYHRIFMGEAVIHASNNPNITLVTNGLISCIGFAGWEPQKKIGFLVHFGGPKQVKDFYSNGVEMLSKKCGVSDLSTFICAIRGGYEKTPASQKILTAIKSDLLSHERIQFKIIDQTQMSKSFAQKSLSIDCYKGQFTDYNIENDPSPRLKTPKEEARDLTFSSIEELVYRRS